MKPPPELVAALDSTGFAWRIESGKKHKKVKLEGRLVAILPHGKEQTAYRRALLNTITQVRRAARELKGAS